MPSPAKAPVPSTRPREPAGRPRRAALALAGLLIAAGCSSAYYSMMETFGVEKREILKDNVIEGRADQQEAKRQFRTTLEAFRAASGFEGGNLEKLYGELNSELGTCESRADRVRSSIDSIEEVAGDLFEEWKTEVARYKDAELRDKSRAMLERTQEDYKQVIGAMRRAEKAMDPVLDGFRDQVLFLKHNLNAAAVSSLHGNVAAIEADVDKLIKDMEASIAEADDFIKTLG
ncbi:MAG TPA: DUF2959 domain-containing protein [Planctomycetota bacterium]|nr:DUF2959 domain-containing protein [Planctomycetota bacterium]